MIATLTASARLFRSIAVGVCVGLFVFGSAQGAVRWFAISKQSVFADAQSQLQTLVDINGHAESNQLCVFGQQSGRYTQAYVYWPAENKLILWVPVEGDPQAIVDSKRYLDLTRDIVTDEANNSSTYMITRDEANETIRACRLHGTEFLIQKSSAPKHRG